jgi:sulfopyruvate decarboxylase TPP-binding subunit
VKKGEEILRALTKSGVTHVVGLPDNISAPLFDAVSRHPVIRMVTVTREGEAFAIATGLWIGGAAPLVVVQNTGLLESGDAVRGTVLRIGAPIPILVTGRGYARMRAAGVDAGITLDRELLERGDLDTAAVFTERTLDAWGLVYRTCEAEDDPAEAIVDAIDGAREREQPVVLVLTAPLT